MKVTNTAIARPAGCYGRPCLDLPSIGGFSIWSGINRCQPASQQLLVPWHDPGLVAFLDRDGSHVSTVAPSAHWRPLAAARLDCQAGSHVRDFESGIPLPPSRLTITVGHDIFAIAHCGEALARIPSITRLKPFSFILGVSSASQIEVHGFRCLGSVGG